MSTYATYYLSKAQKFDVRTATDPGRGEVKIEIKTVFDNLTIAISQAQAKDLAAALQNEITTKEEVTGGDKDAVPF